MTTAQNEPKGLGGWLILPAIGLIVFPLKMFITLTSVFVPIFQKGYWHTLTTPGSKAYHVLWAPFIMTELIGNLLFISFDIILIFLFFMKSYRFPMLYVAFLGLNLAFVLGDFFFVKLIPAAAAEDDVRALVEVTRTTIAAMIWVPYFLLSKRVKNTFVKTTVP